MNREGAVFEDLSNKIIEDDVFQRLLTLHNVLVTGHQALLTEKLLAATAKMTLDSISDAEAGWPHRNRAIEANNAK